MTQTLQAKKLIDVPEYRDAAAKLRQLKATECELKSAISKSEEAARLYMVNHALPDEKLTARLKQQREDLIAAQQAVATQEHAVASARGVASREICAAVRQRHVESQREMALAVIACNEAALAATAIVEELDRNDVSTVGLPVVTFAGTGQGSLDPCSTLAYFVRECIQQGLLKRSDLPADWLQRCGI